MDKALSPARLFLWVFSARRALFVALLFCAAAVAACELAIPWLLQEAVDVALGHEDPSSLNRIGGMMIAVICGLYVAHCFLLRLEARVLYEGMFRLRQRLYTYLLIQPLAFFSGKRTGELVHQVVSDSSVFEDNAVYLFSDLPFELLTVAGVLTLMALTDFKLAVIVVFFLIIASLVSAYVGRPLPTLRKSLQAVGAAFTARLQEALSGVRTVKSFGRERHEIARLDEENQRFLALDLKEGRVEAFLLPVFDLMELLGVVLVVWYGAHLMIENRITAGGLVAFLAYMEILAGPVRRGISDYRHFLQCRAVSERLAGFLSESEALPTRPAPILPAGATVAPAPIIFDQVSLTYPGSERPAIDQVSLTVQPGEVVAIVGRNGAGKSTLMDLLLRLYDPTSGQMVIGGVDLRAWDIVAWRETVGIMTQEVFLFHSTVAENIAYGRPDASAVEIETCALEAGLGGLLKRLPAGLQTVVGDRGNRLSGGERQRVALARLFLKNPKVLILDEPTAHLDGEALRDVAKAMSRLSNGRTTFLIAHRPEIIRLAKRILLLDNGRVVAEGTHEALMASEPVYASLLASLARDRTPRKRQGEGVVEAGVA